MRYQDQLDPQELTQYTRAFNARAKTLGILKLVSLEAIRDVILSSSGMCAWCSVNLLNQDFEIDHIIPLADKGAHDPQNLVVACPSCNRQKSAQSPLKFALALVAKNHPITVTIQRVLDHYQAEPLVQKGLFDD
jgi:CRISPR/Cas system Type II protein with McrA/HNH and RuvC-like nuclease domain